MAKDIAKTLVVGIGGTGQTVIRDIKKRLLRTYGEVPDLVKFLEFDTDDKKQEEDTAFSYYYKGQTFKDFKYQIQDNEYLLTPYLGVEVAQTDPICIDKINMEELVNVSGRLNNKGAGGYRVCGRTIFLQNSQGVINILRQTITNLRDTALTAEQQAEKGYNVLGGNINVFVITSLAGGTGSSAFMDMSRMLQIAGINTQYNVKAGTDQIFGMFFLPKFFEGKPHTQNIQVNTYTALSELDYVLNLNDARKYPLGCREIADDNQDYSGQGGINNGKRVIYTSVYLIDALNRNAQTMTLAESSSYVASFIASSIAADAATILSSFANSNHKMSTVAGKYQNYSGLGYCELRFNRQELVQFMLNRKLISAIEDYKGSSIRRASQIAEEFITNNSLNEGVSKNAEGKDTRAQLNQLTSAIIDMTDPMFNKKLTMAVVNTGKDASENIEKSKIAYLNSIATAAAGSVKSFASTKEQLFTNLRALLDEYQSGKGFGLFPDLTLFLKNSFIAMKEGLDEEIKSNTDKFKAIEKDLVAIKSSIDENSSDGYLWGLFGSKLEIQETWLQAYSNKIRFDMGNDQNPTEARLKVDNARKREAVAIYEELIKIVDEYYKKESIESVDGSEEKITGSSLRVDRLYCSLTKMLSAENLNYKPSKAAVNETLYADAYFKEYFEQHEVETMALTDQNAKELDKYLKEIFTTQPICDAKLLGRMRKKLLDLLPVDGLVRQIQEERMSIDQLFIHCFDTFGQIDNPDDLEANPQLKMLSQLEKLFAPLWEYRPFAGGLIPERHMVVGVYDPNYHIFNTKNGYSAKINGWNQQRSYISLGDPDRIVFMLMETAIPAHMLMNANDWANEYKLKKANTYTFSDKRLENIEMLMPGALDDGEIAWAYGWLFGLITNPKRKRGLRVKPTLEYATKNNVVLESDGCYNYFATLVHSADIYDCHQKFINDQELSMDILKQAMAILESNPIDNIIKLKNWVNDRKMWSLEVRGKDETSMTDNERRVIQNEIKYLAMRLMRLGYGVTLINGVVNHPYSEAIENREKELKA